MDAARGALRFVGWCLALAAVLVVLHRLPAPVGGLGALDLRSRDPADLLPVLLAGARWIALACAWYLAGATTLSTLSAVVGWRPLRRLEQLVTVPAVRRLVRVGLGASLAVGLSVGPAAVAAAAPGPPGASGSPAPVAQLDERAADATTSSRRGGGNVTSAAPADDVPVETDGGSSADVADDVAVDRPGGAGEPVVPPPVVAPPASTSGPRSAAPRQAGVPPGSGATPLPGAGAAPPPGAGAAPPPGAGAAPPPVDGGSAPTGRDAAGRTSPPRTGVTEGTADRAPHRASGSPGAATEAPTSDAATDATDGGVSTDGDTAARDGAEAPSTRGEGAASSRGDDGPASDGTADADTGVAVHVVVTGESFWSIAADLTADELGRDPEDAEVIERWLALIERNRDLLLIPDDPDLLLPGQELRLTEEGR